MGKKRRHFKEISDSRGLCSVSLNLSIIVDEFGNNYNMNKLVLIKNPQLFQGEEYLNKKKNYFEGWYFKNINCQNGISFIPGINIDDTA